MTATTATTEPSTGNEATDPLVPSMASLDLSLSRDQGTLHSSYGAGSEAESLSHPAHENHEKLAHRILSKSSASHALSPENLPLAPKELPISPHLSAAALGLGLPDDFSSSSGPTSTATSAASTPTGTLTPALQPEVHHSIPSSTVATPGTSRTVTPSNLTSVPAINGSKPTLNGSSATAVAPAKPAGKSVFGKLFERGNASTASVASSVNGSGGSGGEKMEKGDSAHSNHGPGGAALVRQPSKKELEKVEKERLKAEKERVKAEEKEREREEKAAKEAAKEAHQKEKLLRVPSGNKRASSQESRNRSESTAASTNGEATHGGRSRAASQGDKEKDNGLGTALNDFMRNKVQRKSSVTSKRSDDGKSDRGGSEKGDNHSQYAGSEAGRSSLAKKYGVCEKIAIGKGATATVKLAHKWDRSTERLYAVKEFRKRRKNETEKEYVKKLTSEFCISSTLHHHNIVETVDLVQDEQSHWCEVMEYCPGGDLYAMIKKGNLTSLSINSYFKQILAGVAYLHSMGVAHRDIKPENLLLDAKGHVKITDFGVSDVFRMCWEKTTHLSKGLCGSEPYIAPEQFEQKEYDARLVDVWACAVVFYCMHFQELPWRVAKTTDPSFGPYVQLYNGTSSPPPLSNLVPRECRQVIRKMLDPNPKTRATTDSILADPWFAAIEVTPPLEGILPTTPAPTTPNLNGSAH